MGEANFYYFTCLKIIHKSIEIHEYGLGGS